MSKHYKATGGLLLGLLLVSPLVLIVFWPSIGPVSIPEIDIDSATVAVFTVVIALNILVGADVVFSADAEPFEKDHLMVKSIRGGIGVHLTKKAHLPVYARLARRIEKAAIGALGKASDAEVHDRPQFERYKEIRQWWWGDEIEMGRKVFSRYIPGFLLAGTGLARFILDVPLIPLTG